MSKKLAFITLFMLSYPFTISANDCPIIAKDRERLKIPENLKFKTTFEYSKKSIDEKHRQMEMNADEERWEREESNRIRDKLLSIGYARNHYTIHPIDRVKIFGDSKKSVFNVFYYQNKTAGYSYQLDGHWFSVFFKPGTCQVDEVSAYLPTNYFPPPNPGEADLMWIELLSTNPTACPPQSSVQYFPKNLNKDEFCRFYQIANDTKKPIRTITAPTKKTTKAIPGR